MCFTYKNKNHNLMIIEETGNVEKEMQKKKMFQKIMICVMW